MDPEICAITLETGKVAAHIRARTKSDSTHALVPPGNLLLYKDALISRTTDTLIAYPPLQVKLGLMDAGVANNPNDPKTLIDRADLRLEAGNVAGAVEDLQKALDANPTRELRARIADLLQWAGPDRQKELEGIGRRLKDGDK
jgi:hypothetical protein